jgi:GNAT superfamily N-acetyltransferase
MKSEVPPLFTIRRATAADAPVLARHRCEMWLAMKDLCGEGYAEMYDQCVRYFDEAIHEGSYRGWLATTAAGEVVAGGGFLLRRIAPFPGSDKRVCRSEKQAHILNIFTESGYRRFGLARRLVETMLDWCEAEGVESVTLNASGEGRPLYEKLNFSTVGNFMKWNGKAL